MSRRKGQRTGAMRQRLDLQAKGTTSPDSRGQFTDAWTTEIPGIPASIKTLFGSDAELTRQVSPTATHKISTRFNSAITEGKRFVMGSRVFSIGPVETFEECRREMLVTVSELK